MFLCCQITHAQMVICFLNMVSELFMILAATSIFKSPVFYLINNWRWVLVKSDVRVEIEVKVFKVSLGRGILLHGLSPNPMSSIRSKLPVVDWWSMVQHSFSITRHIYKLADLRNRLSTCDRFLSLHYQGNSLCVFCGSYIQSRDHLFIECKFIIRIWHHIES